MTHRKPRRRHQNQSRSPALGRARRKAICRPRGVRCIGGVTLLLTWIRNVGTRHAMLTECNTRRWKYGCAWCQYRGDELGQNRGICRIAPAHRRRQRFQQVEWNRVVRQRRTAGTLAARRRRDQNHVGFDVVSGIVRGPGRLGTGVEVQEIGGSMTGIAITAAICGTTGASVETGGRKRPNTSGDTACAKKAKVLHGRTHRGSVGVRAPKVFVVLWTRSSGFSLLKLSAHDLRALRSRHGAPAFALHVRLRLHWRAREARANRIREL